jgi:16S rRNA (adenine1518-N6/adenine1519-N6)-dimethyltransferase
MVRARKRFGQHFLEPAWVGKVVQAINPRESDAFVEIGPGRGALTRPLVAAAARVAAFEIDRELARSLALSLDRGPGPPSSLTVVEGDFLDATPARVAAALGAMEGVAALAPVLRVAGNLPYNVASPILFKLIELYRGGLAIRDATLMLQREVADRLCAAPGGRDYGVLTILVSRHARIERLLELPPGAFRPVPEVRSTVLRLSFHQPAPATQNEAVLESLIRAIFTRRRKTLSNALLAFPGSSRLQPGSALEAAGVPAGRRPETLTPEEICRLADLYTAVDDKD